MSDDFKKVLINNAFTYLNHARNYMNLYERHKSEKGSELYIYMAEGLVGTITSITTMFVLNGERYPDIIDRQINELNSRIHDGKLYGKCVANNTSSIMKPIFERSFGYVQEERQTDDHSEGD